MGIISRSLDHLTDALPTPASPPHYREVDVSSSKLRFTSETNEGLRGILFKGIENLDTTKFERIQKGINLAKEKTELMKERLKGFPSLESLRLPKNYVSLKSLIENGQSTAPQFSQILAMSSVTSTPRTPGEQAQGEPSSKRERGETFSYIHKGRKNNEETTAHEASATSPFSKYDEKLQNIPLRMENPSTKGFGDTLLVNIDCLSYDEFITVLHNVHAWALQRKAETKAEWSDIVTQIIWSFTGILKQWWDKLSDREMNQIVENEDDPLKALFDALTHEFVGIVPEDSAHHSQLFLSQRLCNIDYLQ